MKRQDMLHKIAGTLSLIITSHNMNVEHGAELMLSIIEEAGMVFPVLPTCETVYNVNNWDKEIQEAVLIPEDHDPQY